MLAHGCRPTIECQVRRAPYLDRTIRKSLNFLNHDSNGRRLRRVRRAHGPLGVRGGQRAFDLSGIAGVQHDVPHRRLIRCVHHFIDHLLNVTKSVSIESATGDGEDVSMLAGSTKRPAKKTKKDRLDYASPFHTQVAVLLQRTWLTIWREKVSSVLRPDEAH